MARVFSTNFTTVLNSDVIRYFFLIELNLNNDYYFTSYPSDIPYNGNTYISDGGVFEVDSPRFSSVVDREAYKIVLTDIDNTMSTEFSAGVIGAPIKVMVGLIDSNNQPLLSAGDIVEIYSGFVDKPEISIDWETKYASIEGTSPMSDLDRINLTMVSKDGMDNINTNDTSFDEIYGGREITFKWGKV